MNAGSQTRQMEAAVISINKDSLVLETNNRSVKQCFYVMDKTSVNTFCADLFPRLREVVTIREVVEKGNAEDSSTTFFVSEFEYVPRAIRSYLKKEVMAVAQIHQNYITLVGKSFEKEAHVCTPRDTSSFTVGQLVMGDLFELPASVDVIKENNNVFYMQNRKVVPGTIRGLMYPENIRPLTPEEEEKVFNRCANVKDITLQEAQRFIEEPLIAAGLLEKYLQYQEVEKYMVTIEEVDLRIDERGTPILSFNAHNSVHQLLFQTQSHMMWRVGGELQVSHKMLGKAEMIIKNVEKFCEEGYKIELHSTVKSKHVLKAAFNYRKALEGADFVISPIYHDGNVIVDALKNNFDEFFLERRALFDQCTGRVKKPVEGEVQDKEELFFVNGRPLDSSQLDFMKSAATTPGFTCAQAPPGCGKTHTTSALISYLNKLKVKGGICISGTTNAAVTNAADAVASRFPDIKIIREYSAKAEANISEVSKKASLKHMAEDVKKYVNVEKEAKLLRNLADMQYAREELDEEVLNLTMQLSKVEHVTGLEKLVKKNFVDAYNMQVYATTVEILIRRGDVFRGNDKKKDNSLRRLILDESAQMSPLEAMALYCIFPHLEFITLLGDMKQLGPHTTLPQDTMCHKLLSEGELTRMYKLKSTTKKELNVIYRCHPTITEKLLVPIYGPQIKAGASAASRSLAEDHKLLRGKGGSPCVLIDVDGKEEKGVNQKEIKTALDLIFDIVDVKGVSAEDVVVICNHKAQMNILLQEMKGQGQFGLLKTKVEMHTVDSFQGKEAKVVIVLTTKTCSSHDDGKQKMKFVGDAARGTVAVSRAQHALYVLGHWASLAKTEFWSQFLVSNTVVPGINVNRQALKNGFNGQLQQTTSLLSGMKVSVPPRNRRAFNPVVIHDSVFRTCPNVSFFN